MKKKYWFLALLILLCSAGGVIWHYVLPNYQLGNSAVPVAEIVRINVPEANSEPQPVDIYFSLPAANIIKVNRNVNDGVEMYPAVKGDWIWLSDAILRFMPEVSLTPDTQYKVKLSDNILSPNSKIKDKQFTFNSPAFTAKVTNGEFYENPTNGEKVATASFEFNYPFNTQNIKDKIKVVSVSGKEYDFSYKSNEKNTILYVVSAPLTIGKAEDFAKISVKGVENIYNQKTLKDDVVASVKIPSTDTFFQIKNVKSSITYNEAKNNDAEQILAVSFSTAVKSDDLKNKLELYYVPQYCYEVKEKFANQQNNIAEFEPKQKLKITQAPQENSALKTHLFKFDNKNPYGCLIAVVKKGLQSAEGYVLAQDKSVVAEYMPYPREVKIATSGAIMAKNGSRVAEFVSRGVKELKVKVARISEENLNHLVTQTYGDFAHPFFRNYDFNENNISEVFEKTLSINSANPAKANYAALDLHEYFRDKKGVFFIKVRGTAAEGFDTNEDSRLVVITDLGIVVKDAVDGNHDIFISDITKGEPVSGATVEVLGKNGLPILKAVTNERGLAKVPDFSNFKDDKEAVVYKVYKDGDLSFLPINQISRNLNLSRFDVGGEYDWKQGIYALRGSVFSDRGIYRPGETAYFGIILRQSDLKVPAKLPLVIEVRNSNGDLVANRDLETENYGLMTFEYKVPQITPLGQYQIALYLKNDDNTFFIADTNFKVDEFLPDNLRIKAEWVEDFGKGWVSAKKLAAKVSLHNLYGTPAVGHEVKSSYILRPTTFHFKEYEGYEFLAPLANKEHKREVYQSNLVPQKTNEVGEAVLDFDVSQFEYGPYNLQAVIEGFELGSGRGVKTSLGALLSEKDFLIGWKADGSLEYIKKNAKRSVAFVAINNRLQAIDKDDLVLKLYRRKSVSNLVEMTNGTYGYKMVLVETEIAAKKWKISVNRTSEELKTDEAGDYILAVEDNNGSILAKLEWSVAGEANVAHVVDKEANLGLKLDSNEYAAGAEIEMQISAPYSGYGLITIERDSVYAYKWFKANTPTLIEKIKLPEGVEGNAYVNVAFFRDIHSPEIYMPALSYAAVPFSINKDNRKLDIQLEVPHKVKSGQNLVIKYKTPENAKVIIYGVNQGILQVAHYQQPNPLLEFLPKKALRVVTAQIMDLIMPDVRILRALSSSGGDDSYDALALLNNINPFARKNDKPVVFWSGIVDSNAEGGEYIYRVPDNFNGEIKVMAVGVSEKCFGSASKNVAAHGDFALIPSGPLTVAPQDEFVISVSVGNMVENSGKDYPLEVQIAEYNGFELLSDKIQSINVSENAEDVVKYRLKALDNLGAKNLVFTVEGKDDSTKKAKTEYTMSIRPSAPYNSKFILGHTRAKYVLKDIEDLYDGYRSQQISASASPLVLSGSLLKYLDKFPHFCTEQTISKVFPAIEVFFKYPELVKNIDVYALFDDAIVKLYERQTVTGGFSAWTASGAEDAPYASVYATHFLVKAKEYNFNVPQGMLSNALNYCAEQASRQPQEINDFVPAYATYVLTLSGKITSNYLLNLEEFYKDNYAKEWTDSLSASFMAASYKMLQDEKKADSLVNRYKDGKEGYESAINDFLLAKHFPNTFAIVRKEKIDKLLDNLSSGYWTTSSAAWSILALNATDSIAKDESILFDGKAPQIKSPFPAMEFSQADKKIIVTADSPFYYAVSQQGFVKDGSVKVVADGVEITKTIYDKNGNTPENVKIGDELTVVINIRSLQKENINDVAVVDLLAGGFEVIDKSLETDWHMDSYEVREDRVLLYITATKQNMRISYKVKAIAQGKFIVPAVYASALYQPLVRANSAMAVIQIDE